ncbi:MAG: TAXI family TRAP transporter solute-binding subunit, partial [Myxococcales bacterium]
MRRFAVLAVSVMALLSRSAGAQGHPVNINVATATTGGAYYPIGNAIAQVWNDKVPGVRASAQATNGTP